MGAWHISDGPFIIAPLDILPAPLAEIHLGPTLIRGAWGVAVAMPDDYGMTDHDFGEGCLETVCTGFAAVHIFASRSHLAGLMSSAVSSRPVVSTGALAALFFSASL